MHDEACEKTLGGTYRLERKVRDVVAQTCSEVVHFRAEE